MKKETIDAVIVKVPVSLWDVLETAQNLRAEIFRDPDDWYLSNISSRWLEFKRKEKNLARFI